MTVVFDGTSSRVHCLSVGERSLGRVAAVFIERRGGHTILATFKRLEVAWMFDACESLTGEFVHVGRGRPLPQRPVDRPDVQSALRLGLDLTGKQTQTVRRVRPRRQPSGRRRVHRR